MMGYPRMCSGVGTQPWKEGGLQVDLSKLNLGEKLVAGGGIALLIFSFFPWLGFSYGPFSSSGSAWKFTLCWIAVVLGVAAAAIAIVKLFDVKKPELGAVTWTQVIFVLTALAVLGPSEPARLCDLLHLERSTLSRNLERMRSQGDMLSATVASIWLRGMARMAPRTTSAP
jgi:hypothetical protein